MRWKITLGWDCQFDQRRVMGIWEGPIISNIYYEDKFEDLPVLLDRGHYPFNFLRFPSV